MVNLEEIIRNLALMDEEMMRLTYGELEKKVVPPAEYLNDGRN